MIIKTILKQSRRDFVAIYQCEHCSHSYQSDGYDDKNFHENVIPKMVCKKCDKVAGENYQPRKTKYPSGYEI